MRILLPHPITNRPTLPELEGKKLKLEIHVGDNRVLLHLQWNGKEEWFPFTVTQAEQVSAALHQGAQALAMQAMLKTGGSEIIGPI